MTEGETTKKTVKKTVKKTAKKLASAKTATKKASTKTAPKKTAKKDVVLKGSLKAPVFNKDGGRAGEVDLLPEVFGLAANPGLVHRLLLMQLGNRRQASAAHTLEKGEVRGGGRKPHQQKGTGRARTGSTRNPNWRGGGVAFGPRNVRNFTTAMNKKERRKAMFCCLSSKAAESKVMVLESFDGLKTKEFHSLIKKLPVNSKLLVVLSSKHEAVERSSKNIPDVKSILVNYLNPHDILRHEGILFMKDALPKLAELFLK